MSATCALKGIVSSESMCACPRRESLAAWVRPFEYDGMIGYDERFARAFRYKHCPSPLREVIQHGVDHHHCAFDDPSVVSLGSYMPFLR